MYPILPFVKTIQAIAVVTVIISNVIEYHLVMCQVWHALFI